MTDEELMRQALNVLEDSCYPRLSDKHTVQYDNIIAALHERLGQPEQKPYAWTYQNAYTDSWYLTWEKQSGGRNWTPLYAAPPKREWVGLTDETIWLEYQRFWPFHPAEEPTLAKDIAKFAHVIEAKLKEKNT